jgi:hypothetical protein
MDELEKLISRIARPQPSDELDRRVEAILRHANPRPARRQWKYAALLCGTAVCAGAIGFALGSQTALHLARPPEGSLAALSGVEREEESSQTVDSLLSEEQLASLFMRSAAQEGLWGAGELQIETSTAP